VWWFHALTITTVILQLINFWILAQGKLKTSYYLLLAIYISLIVVELTLALRDTAGQWSVGLYVLVDAWAIAMAILGIRRINKAEAARSHPNTSRNP